MPAPNNAPQDQREALRWVRHNIAAFGGNKNNVLIFGHSSGGGSVSAHMVMHRSFEWFDKAIPQSGSFSNWATHSWEAATHTYGEVARAAAATHPACAPSGTMAAADDPAVRDCLVNLSWEEIQAVGNAGGVPCRDGCNFAPVRAPTAI
jgi:carboxylesterase type B